MTGEPSTSGDDLIAHVTRTTGLSRRVAQRLVDDVLAFHRESVEVYVVRRHRELADAGWKNEAIYARLRDEVAGRLFAGPSCTARQIRRMIYG